MSPSFFFFGMDGYQAFSEVIIGVPPNIVAMIGCETKGRVVF